MENSIVRRGVCDMGLPDDLQALEDLHEKGKLTDQEFADAKAATLRKYQGTSTARRSLFSIRPGFAVLGALLTGFLVWIWYNAGTRATTNMLATAVHAPITVEDAIENVPAASWKAVALNLPYSGTVGADVEVVRGNPIDVFLTTTDQLETMKRNQWNKVRVYTDFSASKTKTYRRSGQLGQGTYYLVLRDNSLGILSMSASDISVKVKLNP